MLSRTVSLAVIGLALIAGSVCGCAATPPPAVEGPKNPETLLAVTDPVAFLGPKGQSVAVEPGTYRVAAAGGDALKLTRDKGGGALVLAASRRDHKNTIATPLAVAVAGEADAQHLILLLPGGEALEAVGAIGAVMPPGSKPGQIDWQQAQRAYVSLRSRQAETPAGASLPIRESLPSGYHVTKIAQADLGGGRRIGSFIRGSLNNSGHAAYGVVYADTKPGKHSILLFNGLGSRVIAAGKPRPFVDPESNPILNDAGHVVFRAHADGTTAIWRWDGSTLAKIVSTEDTPYTVIHQPSLNNAGAVAYAWQIPQSAAKAENTGIDLWKDGTSKTIVDEDSTPFLRKFTIGNAYLNSGGDVLFWAAKKDDWLKKGLYIHRDDVNNSVTDPGARRLPNQVKRLAFDDRRNVYFQVVAFEGTTKETRVMKHDGKTARPFPSAASPLNQGAVPRVSAKGRWAKSAKGILYGSDEKPSGIVRVGGTLDGRTVKSVILHDINDRGSILFEARFKESGATLFRADPP